MGATLQVLQLANNRITSIAGLQLLRMPELRVLYLQGNDIQQIDGLDGCPQLRELVLDRNKIKKLDPRAFVNIQVWRDWWGRPGEVLFEQRWMRCGECFCMGVCGFLVLFGF